MDKDPDSNSGSGSSRLRCGSESGKVMPIQLNPDTQQWLYSIGIGTCLRVVEIAEHLVSLNTGLVHGAEAGLRLELVEAGLHVTDGSP
jgi:hypothetical protein